MKLTSITKQILAEAEMEEVSKKVAGLVKKMEEHTKKKDVNSTLAELAKFFNNKKLEKVMKSLSDIEDELNTMPYGLVQFRNEVTKDLLALAKQRLNGKEYEAVYRAI